MTVLYFDYHLIHYSALKMATTSGNELSSQIKDYVCGTTLPTNMFKLKESLQSSASPQQKFQLIESNRDVYGNTAVHAAAKRCHPELITSMFDSLADDAIFQLLMLPGLKSRTAVHCAANKGSTKSTKALFCSLTSDQRYEVMKLQESCGRTAAHFAAQNGHTEFLAYMLEMVAPDKRCELLLVTDCLGDTPFHHAARHGHIEVVKCILDLLPSTAHELLYKITNTHSQTALDVASRCDQRAVVEYMKQCRMSSGMQDPQTQGTLQQHCCIKL